MSKNLSPLFGIIISLVLGFVVIGCGTNYLPEYYPLVETTRLVSSTKAKPVVYIGSSFQVEEPAAFLTDVLTSEVSEDVQKKLSEAASGDELSSTLFNIFSDGLSDRDAIDVVTDPEEEHDARIELTVTEYGIAANSMESQVYYYFRCEAKMFFISENKLVWERQEYYQYPVEALHIYGDDAKTHATNTAINVQALKELTVEQLHGVFTGMATEAGNDLLEQMMTDKVAD